MNSPGRGPQKNSQTCDVVVLKILPRMPDGCDDDLGPGGSEVPGLKLPPSPAEIISSVLREDCDRGSRVQIVTISNSRQPVD